jgi:adiponectin receptor
MVMVMLTFSALRCVTLCLRSYVSGALMFAFRVPEIWFPGRHDIWFHSHQWMHICVVAAAFIHWMGLLELLKIRLHTPCVDI